MLNIDGKANPDKVAQSLASIVKEFIKLGGRDALAMAGVTYVKIMMHNIAKNRGMQYRYPTVRSTHGGFHFICLICLICLISF